MHPFHVPSSLFFKFASTKMYRGKCIGEADITFWVKIESFCCLSMINLREKLCLDKNYAPSRCNWWLSDPLVKPYLLWAVVRFDDCSAHLPCIEAIIISLHKIESNKNEILETTMNALVWNQSIRGMSELWIRSATRTVRVSCFVHNLRFIDELCENRDSHCCCMPCA